MIADLKPYAEYKDSGLPWLGELPANWITTRTKTRFRLSIEKSGKAHGKELLSVYTHIGVRPRKDLEQRGNKASSTDGYWVVRKGDIIVNKLLAWMGAVGVSHFDGVTSPAYDILRPTQQLESDYYHHLFRTKLYLGLFKAQSRGIMDMRLRLYFDKLGQIPLICPPPDEQAAIVRFLDWANGRLERAIRAKRKVIALLNEQKQAIIHRAVTRGLDPSVPLKPSGIPWLGDIPEHWEVRQARHFGRLLKGTGGSKEDATEEGIPCVRYGELYTKYKNFIRKARTYVSPDRATSYTPIYYGDVLFAASGEKIEEIGKSAVNLMKEEAVCGGDIVILRPTVPAHAPFLGYACDSYEAVHQKATMCRGTTIKHIYPDELRSLQVCFPPINEQEKIATSLDADLFQLNIAISRLEREIDLLREYRTRLVADVVTGKLDVREAAARLNDEAPEAPERLEYTEPDGEDAEMPEETEE